MRMALITTSYDRSMFLTYAAAFCLAMSEAGGCLLLVRSRASSEARLENLLLGCLSNLTLLRA